MRDFIDGGHGSMNWKRRENGLEPILMDTWYPGRYFNGHLISRKIAYNKESFGVVMLLLTHDALILQSMEDTIGHLYVRMDESFLGIKM